MLCGTSPSQNGRGRRAVPHGSAQRAVPRRCCAVTASARTPGVRTATGRRLTFLATLALAALLISSCGGGDSPTPSGTVTHRGTFNALADPQQVPVLARQHLGTEEVTVRRVSLTETGFQMEVRDPAKPENLDRYAFHSGDWTSGPVSVSMSDIEALNRTTFGIGTVDWSVIPQLQQRALDGLDLEDEEISNVSVDRLADDRLPRIYVAVTGARGSGSLLADGRGRNVVIRRN